MKRILILGATSTIAFEISKKLALKDNKIFLVARDESSLKSVCDDLTSRGAKTAGFLMDFCSYERIKPMKDDALAFLGTVDLMLIAYGSLADNDKCQKDTAYMRHEIEINYTSVATIIMEFAEVFEQQRSGIIAVITSVAGDRGRRLNYIYGSAKAGLTAFLSGLRSKMYLSGVRVVDIRPGFVESKMTAHLKKGILFASADKVAEVIVAGIEKGKDIIYVPWFWYWIMFIVKCIPEFIFKKMNF